MRFNCQHISSHFAVQQERVSRSFYGSRSSKPVFKNRHLKINVIKTGVCATDGHVKVWTLLREDRPGRPREIADPSGVSLPSIRGAARGPAALQPRRPGQAEARHKGGRRQARLRSPHLKPLEQPPNAALRKLYTDPAWGVGSGRAPGARRAEQPASEQRALDDRHQHGSPPSTPPASTPPAPRPGTWPRLPTILSQSLVRRGFPGQPRL